MTEDLTKSALETSRVLRRITTRYTLSCVTDQGLREVLVRSVMDGSLLVLNFDNDGSKYEHLYDPEIDKFVNSEALHPSIWRFKDFAKREIQETIGTVDPNQDTEARLHAYNDLPFEKFQVPLSY